MATSPPAQSPGSVAGAYGSMYDNAMKTQAPPAPPAAPISPPVNAPGSTAGLYLGMYDNAMKTQAKPGFESGGGGDFGGGGATGSWENVGPPVYNSGNGGDKGGSALPALYDSGGNGGGSATTDSASGGAFTDPSDWRVRVESPVLGYNGILSPLGDTNGVIFPYTPSIQVTYAAAYDATPLTHSNYKVHMYTASSVENIQVTGDFTAQDSTEAAYVLAVIHFFKSVTKMYYGQDSRRGTPPPLCYLTGLGEYQFKRSPMAVTNFALSLPADVDYISTSSSSGSGGSVGFGGGLSVGGEASAPVFNSSGGGNTMVPTKMQISFSAIPIVSRLKVSNEFSLEKYSTGSLLGAGFW
jgi:hypothetical protein